MGREEERAREKELRRRAKEEKEFNKNAKKVWGQLTDKEKQLLTELKEQEIKEAVQRVIQKTLDKTFSNVKKSLIKAMREHKIGNDRIQEIIGDFLLYVDKDQGYKIENITLKDDYMIMERLKFHEHIKDLVCETLHYRCKGCMENKKSCSLFPIYQKLDIPTSSWRRKNCKYSYE